MSADEVKPEWLQCAGKERFDGGDRANHAIRQRKKRKGLRSGAGDRPLQAYRCPHCGFWHLGGARTL